jgi:ubiquinone/menaquinone biosynthesis C-methylase UbiE
MLPSGDLFRELTEGLPRQGPGSSEATLRALRMVDGLSPRPRVLDVGCGPGAQTIDLARASGGQIVALDLRGHFLSELTARARAAGLADRITAVRGSMSAMEFADGEFDLIWSEGAIYIMGFGAGLSAWRRFLKPGGSIAVSELSWLTPDPPMAVREHWAREYPGMHSIEENRQIAAQVGYEELQAFTLPSTDWWRNYYGPGEARLLEVRARHRDDPETVAILDERRREYDLFRAHSDAYGYVFYIMRKPRA